MKNITPNRSGAGSTYGGTQSPNPDAPDGYQKPAVGEEAATSKEETKPKAGLGKEYNDDSSYGSKDADATKPDTTAKGKKDDAAEEGSPIR